MEHVGHYYTVYFTSLAVGFNEKTAFRQAVYAQMPDQVDRLDATTIHKDACSTNKIPPAGGYVSEQWRGLGEYVLHGFPYASSIDKSAKTQQDITKKLLQKESPDSLAFGFLLHRLGDVYAHIDKDNVTNMYPVAARTNRENCNNYFEWGHFKDGHDSDYPFVRPSIFYNYLEALYQILFTKVTATENSMFRRNYIPMAYNTLKTVFKNIIESPAVRMMPYKYPPSVRIGRSLIRKYGVGPLEVEVEETYYIIRQIRRECELKFGIRMNERYQPEKDDLASLENYKNNNAIKELFDKNLNEDAIRQTLDKIDKDLPENFSQHQYAPDIPSFPPVSFGDAFRFGPR